MIFKCKLYIIPRCYIYLNSLFELKPQIESVYLNNDIM